MLIVDVKFARMFALFEILKGKRARKDHRKIFDVMILRVLFFWSGLLGAFAYRTHVQSDALRSCALSCSTVPMTQHSDGYIPKFVGFRGFGYPGRIRPGIVSPTRTVPDHILKPDYTQPRPTLPTIKSAEDIGIMREAGRIARSVSQYRRVLTPSSLLDIRMLWPTCSKSIGKCWIRLDGR